MPFQMALDEILFREMVESPRPKESLKPLVRFYYSSEPWISVGYAYAGWKDAEGKPGSAAKQIGGVPVCRRMTGGGQVLHGGDLMFTVIAPKTADGSFGSVRESYAKIHECLKAAIEETGRKPSFYRPDAELPKGKECFLFPIESDLALEGEKIAGGGQKRSLGILMHQESVQMAKLGDPEELRPRIERQFERQFNMSFEAAEYRPELFMQAERLGAVKYLVRETATAV